MPDRVSIPTKDILKMMRNMVNFPFPQICVHSVAGNLLSLLEENGGTADMPPEELNALARAIVRAEDDVSYRMLTAIIERTA